MNRSKRCAILDVFDQCKDFDGFGYRHYISRIMQILLQKLYFSADLLLIDFDYTDKSFKVVQQRVCVSIC